MSIKLKFRPSAKAGGMGTLVYQVIHERKVTRIKSKYQIYPHEWDNAAGAIAVAAAGKDGGPADKRHRELVQIAASVQREVKRLAAVESALAKRGRQFTSHDVAGVFKSIDVSNSVFTFLDIQIERLRQLGRMRCSEMLRATANRLVEFRCGIDFMFYMLDGSMMEQFEAHLKRRGLRRNTIGFYMRTLRTYYNRAVDSGLTKDNRPFRKVYTGKDKTVKRALTIDEIRRIKQLDLAKNPRLDFARDMLLFSFYTRGMSFVDMAYLKKSDLQDGHFTYSRRKTGQTLCVEWIEQMQRIVDKYVGIGGKRYLLPIILDNGRDERTQYLYQSQRINRSLREIGRMAQVSGGPCTMYRARHSWATLARAKNVPIAVISEALGHDSERTTEIYLGSIQTAVVDKVNRLLLKEL